MATDCAVLRLLYGVAAAATYLILTSATPDGSILQLALALQMLSVLDVSVQITSTYSGYARGNLVARTLLSAPIIATACSSDFPAALRGLLAALRLRSPIVQRFRTMFEAPVPGVGQPLLPPAAIERIVQQHRDRGPVAEMEQLHNMAADFTNRVVGVLANDVPLSRHQLPRRGTMMPIGSAFVRASGLVPLSADSAAPLGSLSVRPRPSKYAMLWLCLATQFKRFHVCSCLQGVEDLTLEAGMFPYAFPFGTGQFDATSMPFVGNTYT